jgi:hypothetical protein
MVNNHWSVEDTAYLIENYEDMSFYEMADVLGVEYKRVKDRFIHLRQKGIIPEGAKAKFGRNDPKKWSNKEIKLLKKMIDEKASIDEIYDAFSDRNRNSVCSYFYFIKKKMKGTYKSEVCNIDPRLSGIYKKELKNIGVNTNKIDCKDQKKSDEEKEVDDTIIEYSNVLYHESGDVNQCCLNPIVPKKYRLQCDKYELSDPQPRRRNWLKFGLISRIGKFFTSDRDLDMKKVPIWKGKKSSVWKTPIEEL